MNKLEFKECETCSIKLGSPILCESCLNNRKAIEWYKSGWIREAQWALDNLELLKGGSFNDGLVYSNQIYRLRELKNGE